MRPEDYRVKHAPSQEEPHGMMTATTPTRPGLAADSSPPSCPSSTRPSPPPTEPAVLTAHLPETFDPSAIDPKRLAYACWIISAVVFRRYIDRGADELTFVPLAH